MSQSDNASSPRQTPKKRIHIQDAFELPDTPTSLASSFNNFNKDVILSPNKGKTLDLGTLQTQNTSIQSSSIADCTKGTKYNPLHDSIEDFISDRRSALQHNVSLLNDFQDLKLMMDTTQTGNSQNNSQSYDTGDDLVQKWLEDRKRWDTIQQTYEQKVTDMQNKLKSKTLSANKKLDTMLNQEVKYKEEIKKLHQQIDSLKSSHIETNKYTKLERNYQEITDDHRELNNKYKTLQKSYRVTQQQLIEKDAIIQRLQQNDQSITEQEIIALHTKLENATKENERLKQLELTSQNMVERLLKRLEQQIHSAENTQHELNFKEKEHDKEILRLKQINSKLQKHLTVLNKTETEKQLNNNAFPSSPSTTCSDDSLFTLSTVQTAEQSKSKIAGWKTMSKKKINEVDACALKKENMSLKGTITKLRDMLNAKDVTTQNVLIEKLKSEITEHEHQVNECKHNMKQYETVINDHKETIQKLQHTIDEQQNGITMLEKSNSDISMQVIEERTQRQTLEKQIEDLQFENKQLRNKLVAFKRFASQTIISDHVKKIDCDAVDEIGPIRPATANNAANNVIKDQLLVDGLKELLHKYEKNIPEDDEIPHRRYSYGATRANTADNKNRKQFGFNTPKSSIITATNMNVEHVMNKKNSVKINKKHDDIAWDNIRVRSKRRRKRSTSKPVSVYRSKSTRKMSSKKKTVKGKSMKKKKISTRYPVIPCVHKKQWT